MLRSPHVKQRDEDGRGSRPAPSNDIRNELVETAIPLVHPVGQTKNAGTHFFGGVHVESVSSRIRGRVNDVVCNPNVS